MPAKRLATLLPRAASQEQASPRHRARQALDSGSHPPEHRIAASRRPDGVGADAVDPQPRRPAPRPRGPPRRRVHAVAPWNRAGVDLETVAAGPDAAGEALEKGLVLEPDMALVSRLGLGRRDPRWVEPELRGLRLRDDGIAVEQ